jgi:hypothetical protein
MDEDSELVKRPLVPSSLDGQPPGREELRQGRLFFGPDFLVRYVLSLAIGPGSYSESPAMASRPAWIVGIHSRDGVKFTYRADLTRS